MSETTNTNTTAQGAETTKKPKVRYTFTKRQLVESFVSLFKNLKNQKDVYEMLGCSQAIYANYIRWYTLGYLDEFQPYEYVSSKDNVTKIKSSSGYQTGSKDEEKNRVKLYVLYEELKKRGKINLKGEAFTRAATRHKFPVEYKTQIQAEIDALNTHVDAVNRSLPEGSGQLSHVPVPQPTGIIYEAGDSDDDQPRKKLLSNGKEPEVQREPDQNSEPESEGNESDDDLTLKFPPVDEVPKMVNRNDELEHRLEGLEMQVQAMVNITENLQRENDDLRNMLNHCEDKIDMNYKKIKDKIKAIFPSVSDYVVNYLKAATGQQ